MRWVSAAGADDRATAVVWVLRPGVLLYGIASQVWPKSPETQQQSPGGRYLRLKWGYFGVKSTAKVGRLAHVYNLGGIEEAELRPLEKIKSFRILLDPLHATLVQ